MKRYPYWYGFGGLFLLAIIGLIVYWTTHSPVEAMSSKPNSSTIQISDEDIERTIITFLNQLAGGHIKESQNYTSGDTYQVLHSNQKEKVNGTLVDHSITILFKNETYAQAKVEATVQTSVGSDRAHYLYSLYKLDKSWKIFKIEDLPVIYQNEKTDMKPEIIKPIIEKYLSAVGKGDWKESAGYLGGSALQEFQKSATFLPKQLKSELTIIHQTPVSSADDKTVLMLVEYDVSNDMKEKSHLKTLFQLEDVGGEWRITKITNVSIEGGSHS